MIVVKGNKKEILQEKDFIHLSEKFNFTVLDIGTGDGKFVHNNAKKDPNTLFIGMDLLEKQLRGFSKKSNRKKLENVLYVLGSADNIPTELFSRINIVYIILPWGSLLEKIIKGDSNFIKKLQEILKDRGVLDIYLGYSPDLEPSETKRLGLPTLDEKYIKENVVKFFEPYFLPEIIARVGKEEMDNISTSWSKKLKYGKDRDIFRTLLRKKEL